MIKTRIKHIFLPHPRLHARAMTLQHWALTFYALVLFSFQFYVYTLRPQILGFAADISSGEIVRLTNEKRVANGASSLSLDSRLEKAAYQKAADMFAKNYWAHYAPDGSTSPWMLITGAGYKYQYAGENLAKNFDVSYEVVEAWMASSSHRSNLLNSNYKHIGVAVANGVLLGEETTLVVQMFGAPLPEPLAVTGSQNPPPEPVGEPVSLAGPAEQTRAASKGEELPRVSEPVSLKVEKLVNPTSSPKTVPLGLGLLFLGLFGADEVYLLKRGLRKKHLLRDAGENLAHIAVLLFMIGLILATKVGGII